MLGLRCCVGFSLVVVSGATLCRSAWTSHCGGFSCCRARALGLSGFSSCVSGLRSCGSQALEHRLNSCGARAQLLCGTWDLPGSGIKPVSPALTSRVFTTEPPGPVVKNRGKKCPPPHFLFSLLLIDTWVASVSWLL